MEKSVTIEAVFRNAFWGWGYGMKYRVLVFLLCAFFSCVNAADQGPSDQLFEAISEGNTSEVVALLRREDKATMLCSQNENGATPLAYAIIMQIPIELKRTLLEAAAQDKDLLAAIMTKYDIQRHTPLLTAVSLGEKEMVESLIGSVDKDLLATILTAQNDTRYSPLMLAISQNDIVMARILLAATSRNMDLLKKILIQKNTYGVIPLGRAIAKGNLEIAKMLLESASEYKEVLTAVLNAQDNNGLTPLKLAEKNRKEKMITLLKEATDKISGTDLATTEVLPASTTPKNPAPLPARLEYGVPPKAKPSAGASGLLAAFCVACAVALLSPELTGAKKRLVRRLIAAVKNRTLTLLQGMRLLGALVAVAAGTYFGIQGISRAIS